MNELADAPSEIKPQVLPPNQYVQSRAYKGLRKYYDAMVHFLIPPCDIEAALASLEEAIALCPDEALYRRIAARLLLSQWDAGAAAAHLAKALECVQSPNELAQTYLLLGFTCDLQGKREDALQQYREVLNSASDNGSNILSAINKFVLADAKKYSHSPYTLTDTKELEVNFEIVGKHDL